MTTLTITYEDGCYTATVTRPDYPLTRITSDDFDVLIDGLYWLYEVDIFVEPFSEN